MVFLYNIKKETHYISTPVDMRCETCEDNLENK